MKNKMKKALRVIAFLLLLCLCLGGINSVFKFHYGDGIYPLDIFYKQEKNSIDVMSFDSSHVFQGVNTQVLWDDYGMASFDLCGSMQPVWNTYYYMKEALKTQTPKVMVMDLFRIIEQEEYSDDSRIIKNNFGLKLSMDKINSIMVSSPQDRWLDYFLEFPTYHTRYTELRKRDFSGDPGFPNPEVYKGFSCNFKVQTLQQPNVKQVTEKSPMSPKTEEYLQKIIDLSKERGIPLVFIVAPYYIASDHQKIYNTAKQIAEDNNIPFLNFNTMYEEIGLNFATDMADKEHMNHIGNTKFTKYLGEYLKSNYDIPDCRNQKGYESYDIMAAEFRQRVNNYDLKLCKDTKQYLIMLNNPDYTITVCLNSDDYLKKTPDNMMQILHTLGVPCETVGEDGTWVIRGETVLFDNDGKAAYDWKQLMDDTIFAISKTDGESQRTVVVNTSPQTLTTNGVTIIVYDHMTKAMVDKVYIHSQSQDKISR